MKKGIMFSLTILALLFTSVVPGKTSENTAAVQEGQEVVAVVNGEKILLDELNRSVAERHQNLNEETPTAWVGYAGALERLINAKLLLQEAADVGLEERPEIRTKVQRYQDRILVKIIKSKQYSGLKPDQSDIERLYRDEIRHWKFRALAFEDFERARAFRDELDGEGNFDTVAERHVQEGLANWEGEEKEVKETDVAPEISAGFIGKEVGSVTPIIRAVDRFFVFKLTDVSYQEDPAARERAARKALKLKREEVLDKYTDRLIEKHVSVDQEVLATVGKGEFTDVEKDSRVLAVIIDEDSVLVLDLFLHLQEESYHGGKASDHVEALKSDPKSVLKDALEKRLYLKEARETGIDRTKRYLELVADFESSLLFGMYIEEFLVPQAQVSVEEIKTVYEERWEEFLLPQEIEVDTLTFGDDASARKALESLRRGTDLKWLSENVRGLKVDGVTREKLTLETLPQELKTLFTEAKTGDTGLYKATNDSFKVYIVIDLPPRKREPFDKARPKIARELFDKNMNHVLEDLTAELRELSEITIYEDKLDRGPFPQDRH